MTAQDDKQEQEQEQLTPEQLRLAADLADVARSWIFGKFCGECGEKMGHGIGCVSCDAFIDPKRVAVAAQAVALHRKALDLLQDADAAEYARGLYDAWDAAGNAVSAAAKKTPVLEAALDAALKAERKAQDRARSAADYARECAEKHRRAKRDHAAPDVQTDAAIRAEKSAGVVQGEQAAAEGATAEREQAESNLAAHRAELARLEDAELAASKAAENPPERVTLGVWSGMLGHPLLTLARPDLTDAERGAIQLQATVVANLSGLDGMLRAEGRQEGRKALEAELRDRAMLTQRVRNGGLVAIPNPGSLHTPRPGQPAGRR